jgi:hypothetical protein
MRYIIFISLICFSLSLSKASNPLTEFLPATVSYNQNIPDPVSWFGFMPGDRHLSHDQVLAYAREIARLSERVVIEEYARSHENRPLVHLIFTSEENQRQLNSLKTSHVNFSQPGTNQKPEDVPLVVLLGYGVHGNESSATNSSVLTMYYLAAAQGPIDRLIAPANHYSGGPVPQSRWIYPA